MIGIIYFVVIILANTIGAVSGMGGGVIIKPLLDLIGAHSVVVVSFYSAVAVFTMSIVSTIRQVKNGVSIDVKSVIALSAGAVFGGVVGNNAFEFLLEILANERTVQMIQIVLTILTLLFALLYSKYDWRNYTLRGWYWLLLCGLILGFLASLLGIGGGPINVSLLMLMFSMPIKEATVYSICTIFFSQLAKLVTIAMTVGFYRYDLTILLYIIPAAICGGLMGATLSKVLSAEKVTTVFQMVILIVLAINVYNGFQLFS